MSALAASVPRAIGRVSFAWPKALWLWAHLAATLVLLPGAFHPGLAAWALIATYLTLCLGHSVGLHRGLIHRTYRISQRGERVLIALFVFTGLGGPRAWIRLHRVRDYWQNEAECPAYFAYRHGLVRDFWWNLHGRFEPRSWSTYALEETLERDAFLGFLERTWWLWNVASYAVLYALGGLDAAVVCGIARVTGGVVGHWFIGYWTHAHGEQRFVVPGASECGTNSRFLGWISFGEGFHNNHHALPDSARMGIERGEFDLGWITLRMLETLHVVHALQSWSRGNVVPRGEALPALQRVSHSVFAPPPEPRPRPL